MRPAPWGIDAGAVRSARGRRRLQRAVTLQRLFQVAAQRRAVLGLLFEDGLLAQQVAVLALDVLAQRLAHRLGLQLQVGSLAQQAEQALAQVDQAQARGLPRFLDQGDALAEIGRASWRERVCQYV